MISMKNIRNKGKISYKVEENNKNNNYKLVKD